MLRRLASRRSNLVIRIVLVICTIFALMYPTNGSGWLFGPNANPIRFVIHIRQKSTSTVWSPSYSHMLKNHIPLVHPMKTRPDFQEQGLVPIPLVYPTKTPPHFRKQSLVHIPLVYPMKTRPDFQERSLVYFTIFESAGPQFCTLPFSAQVRPPTCTLPFLIRKK